MSDSPADPAPGKQVAGKQVAGKQVAGKQVAGKHVAGKHVDCPLHGPCPPAFTCQHIKVGVGCGYHTASGAGPGGDAWCDACEQVRAEAGGWNDKSEAFAGIQVVCVECQDVARYRNERPVGALELGVPADHGRMRRFAAGCRQSVQQRSDQLLSKGAMGQHDRWDFDDQQGTLMFMRGQQPLVVADVQLVGSMSEESKTWAWAWANPGNPQDLVSESRRLLTFGRVRGIEEFTRVQPFPIDVERAWILASMAAELLDGAALYRAEMAPLHHFMVLYNLRRAVR